MGIQHPVGASSVSKLYARSFTLAALVAGTAMNGAAFAQFAAPAPESAAPAAEAPAPAPAPAPAAEAPAPAPAPAAEAPAPAANTPGASTNAQPAKVAISKPPKKVVPTVVIVVTNKRAVPLTELDATPAGAAEPKQIVANLGPGKKTSVKLTYGKSCVFDLHGDFADGSSTDMTSVDLCKHSKINLVE